MDYRCRTFWNISSRFRRINQFLPKQLRISHNFGRVLLDDTEQQQNIIDKEKMFTSDKGNVCIFDPAGMHRGGICNKGTRIALQILMK